MLDNYKDMADRAALIRYACEERENTPERVGGLFSDIVAALGVVDRGRVVEFGKLDSVGLVEAWMPHPSYSVVLTTESDGYMQTVGMLDIFQSHDGCTVTQLLTTNYLLNEDTGQIGVDHAHNGNKVFQYTRYCRNGLWSRWRNLEKDRYSPLGLVEITADEIEEIFQDIAPRSIEDEALLEDV
jgi:hypothetical protein